MIYALYTTISSIGNEWFATTQHKMSNSLNNLSERNKTQENIHCMFYNSIHIKYKNTETYQKWSSLLGEWSGQEESHGGLLGHGQCSVIICHVQFVKTYSVVHLWYIYFSYVYIIHQWKFIKSVNVKNLSPPPVSCRKRFSLFPEVTTYIDSWLFF